MVERRQAQRRQPIEIEVRERVVEARPLPWMKRNDLGNEIMRQYSEMLNSTLKSYVEDRTDKPESEEPIVPQLEIYLNDKIKDPGAVVRLGYPDYYNTEADDQFFDKLDYGEMLDLIYASLDVNHLETLKELVDPNSLAPASSGGPSSPGEDQSDTPSQPSTQDSSSQESDETTS